MALFSLTTLALAIVVSSATLIRPNAPAFDAYNSEKIRYTGRWAEKDSAMVTINTGTTLEAVFTGKTCVLQFDLKNLTEKPQIYVSFGAGKFEKQTVAERIECAVPDSANGRHRLRVIVKAVEEHQKNWVHLEGAVKFKGIETESGLLDLPTPQRVRPLIEFIGDSITAGVLATKEGSTLERMDGRLAYPSVVGRRLPIRVSQVGFGRLGILVEGNGEVPLAETSLLSCFQDAPVKHVVDAVVVNLGTNDGGRSKEDFAPAYDRYLEAVRKLYPKATIICLRPFIGTQAESVKSIVEARQKSDMNLHYVDTTGWLTGEDYTDGVHPNVEGHKKAGEKLALALAPILKVEPRQPRQ